jgi:GNAT superfamily N-acetyltransferase
LTLVRDVSSRALADSPDAFRRTLAEAQALTEDFWRQQAEGSAPMVVVLEDGRGVAMGGVFAPPDSAVAYVWGMWTAPEARGHGYAAAQPRLRIVGAEQPPGMVHPTHERLLDDLLGLGYVAGDADELSEQAPR